MDEQDGELQAIAGIQIPLASHLEGRADLVASLERLGGAAQQDGGRNSYAKLGDVRGQLGHRPSGHSFSDEEAGLVVMKLQALDSHQENFGRRRTLFLNGSARLFTGLISKKSH